MAEQQVPARIEPQADNTQQTNGTDWTASLEPDLRGLVTTKGWKHPGEAIKSYAHLERLVGVDKIPIPGKDAKPEDWDVVYSRLGRPESPDKYDLGDFKPPEGLEWSEDSQKAMLAEMHASGLSTGQAKRLIARYAEDAKARADSFRQKVAEHAQQSEAALRKAWGTAFEHNMDVANRAFKLAAGPHLEALNALRIADGTFIANNPLMVQAFANLGKMMEEHKMIGDGQRSPVMDPESAKAEIARMHGDPQQMKVLNDKSHPEYAQAVAKRDRLYQMAYPE